MSKSDIQSILKTNPIVPVVVLYNVADALPLADAFKAGGITTMEITLRTSAALDVIAKLKKERPDMSIGAGTITTEEKLKAVAQLGVDYVVSPGASESLLKAMKKTGIPALPGVATISEALAAFGYGFQVLKFFPAEQIGGARMIKSFGSVLPDISFCPTGGVKPENMMDYLELSNVLAVGGTWLAPVDIVSDEKWDEVTLRSRQALRQLA